MLSHHFSKPRPVFCSTELRHQRAGAVLTTVKKRDGSSLPRVSSALLPVMPELDPVTLLKISENTSFGSSARSVSLLMVVKRSVAALVKPAVEALCSVGSCGEGGEGRGREEKGGTGGETSRDQERNIATRLPRLLLRCGPEDVPSALLETLLNTSLMRRLLRCTILRRCSLQVDSFALKVRKEVRFTNTQASLSRRSTKATGDGTTPSPRNSKAAVAAFRGGIVHQQRTADCTEKTYLYSVLLKKKTKNWTAAAAAAEEDWRSSSFGYTTYRLRLCQSAFGQSGARSSPTGHATPCPTTNPT